MSDVSSWMKRMVGQVSLGVFVLVSTILPLQNAASAGNYITGTPPGGGAGAVILNEVNGDITYCPTIFNSSSLTEAGTCAKIGQMPAASLLGNAQISTSGEACVASGVNAYCGSDAVIVNTATGAAVECPLWAEYLSANPSHYAPIATCTGKQQAP